MPNVLSVKWIWIENRKHCQVDKKSTWQ